MSVDEVMLPGLDLFRGYSSIGSYRLSLLNSTSLPLVIICADFILEVPGTL